MKKVSLYEWKLTDNQTKNTISDIFVIDRGDNKRRKTSEIKEVLFRLNRMEPSRGITIAGYNEFKGFAESYGCKA